MTPNVEVSHRGQPPLAIELSLSEPAGPGWLDRLVGRPPCEADPISTDSKCQAIPETTSTILAEPSRSLACKRLQAERPEIH